MCAVVQCVSPCSHVRWYRNLSEEKILSSTRRHTYSPEATFSALSCIYCMHVLLQYVLSRSSLFAPSSFPFSFFPPTPPPPTLPGLDHHHHHHHHTSPIRLAVGFSPVSTFVHIHLILHPMLSRPPANITFSSAATCSPPLPPPPLRRIDAIDNPSAHCLLTD